MMKSILAVFVLVCLFCKNASADYTSPGTGVKWTLNDLVANSAGNVTDSSGFYLVNGVVTIAANDTLYIIIDATVRFDSAKNFTINGVIIINPPTGVTFTPKKQSAGFNGMRLDMSIGSIIRKLTLEYAVSLRLSDSSPIIDSCIFRNNNNSTSTSFGNGAIAVFRSNAVITNCQFLNNNRAAIQGGSNINNAPKISGCLFMGNNTTTSSLPQINLGATSTGNDTCKIINNQFLRASIYSGAIGFLPIGNVYAIISGNVIKNNRYGITFNGGSNINAVISYNQIDSNNTQNDPNLGGSGIAFSGGSSSSHQNSIVTGNLIRWNLWGITIQGGSKPNIGNITNADTTDDGKNYFLGNTNANTPNIDLYNNSADDIDAQNNYWGSNDPNVIEDRIFHKPDNAALGLVNYSSYVLPVTLTRFDAILKKDVVDLAWQTASEVNTRYFNIEKSNDGQQFYPIGNVAAAGSSSSTKNYNFTDRELIIGKQMFYRLRSIDKDGTFSFSNIVSIKWNGTVKPVKLYPTVFATSEKVTAVVFSEKKQTISIEFFTANGKRVGQTLQALVQGDNTFTLATDRLPTGVIFVKFVGDGLNETLRLVRR